MWNGFIIAWVLLKHLLLVPEARHLFLSASQSPVLVCVGVYEEQQHGLIIFAPQAQGSIHHTEAFQLSFIKHK